MFNSARTNGYILTTSRSSADDYLILSWTEEVIVTTLETFPKKAESGKVDQTRLDVWSALRTLQVVERLPSGNTDLVMLDSAANG